MQIELTKEEAAFDLERGLRLVGHPLYFADLTEAQRESVKLLGKVMRIALFHMRQHAAILNRVRELEGERAEWREEIERLEQQRDKALDDLAAMTKSRDSSDREKAHLTGCSQSILLELGLSKQALALQKKHTDYLSSVLQDLKQYLSEKENGVIS